MANLVSAPPAPAPQRKPVEGFTVEELGRIVGMSPRNIRAHQARKLLAAPVRRGRIVLYDESHVRRLRTIVALQRQGFNLVSIEAILGARNSDPGAPALGLTLNRIAAEHPALIHALARHRVVARTDDGTVHPARPHVLRAGLKLHGVGLAPARTLQVLGEVLEQVAGVSEELTRASTARILALIPDRAGGSFEDLDRDTVALTQGIIDLLSEAFRVALENCSETIVAALVGRRHGGTLDTLLDPAHSLDNG